MNLAVGFVILFCLFCSEYSAAGTADHLQLRLGGIALLTCLVPLLALLQTFAVNRRRKLQQVDDALWERVCRRVSSCHTAVWLVASIATIYVFRWHDVVRAEWGLDRFVLVDEILILMPVLLSLLASWAVFYDLKSTDELAAPQVDNRTNDDTVARLPVPAQHGSWLFGRRREFVSIRFRLHVLVLVCLLYTSPSPRD